MWRPALAVVVVALMIAAVFLGVTKWADGQCERPNAGPYAKTSSEIPPSSSASAPNGTINDSLKRIAKAQEAIATASKPNDEKDREQRDLEAQQEMACYARWMFYATAFGALVAVCGTALLLATLRLATTSAEKELRAYIHVTQGSVGWSSDEKVWPRLINVKVELKNSGSTPAKSVVNWCRARAFTGDPVFEDPKSDEFDKSVGILGPCQTSQFEFDKSYQFETADEVTACKNGTMTLYVWGEAKYVDAFGQDRHTTFRFVMPKNRVYPEGGKLRPCSEGNDYT